MRSDERMELLGFDGLRADPMRHRGVYAVPSRRIENPHR